MYENKEINEKEQKIWEWKYIFLLNLLMKENTLYMK